jgi:adenine-specific DNA-methyltransferase
MSQNYEKLKEKLKEIFQLNQADLDFGIYRIMNTKRDEILRYLDNDLKPQVKAILETLQDDSKGTLEEELQKAIEGAKAAEIDPDTSPKVKKLREQMKGSVDLDALEKEIFSDLYNFFSRYYEGGDFLSLRRYKEGVYAIPYEGEEVKLHWANSDQYYIKTSEYFTNYSFKLADGKRINFRLVKASTEQNNNKAQEGKDRRFILSSEAVKVENDELIIPFEYKPDSDKRSQKDINQATVIALSSDKTLAKFAPELLKEIERATGGKWTLLEKRLNDYASKNEFDYFIHKDLGGFMRRELDFFIKNEVLYLDDMIDQKPKDFEKRLAKLKALKSIGHKIIAFLAQLEDFQKKLWLKKKFVVETNWCITLDRAPENLYAEIAANDAQRDEWINLFAINEIKGYNKKLSVQFLKDNPHLIIDTALFPNNFKVKLLENLNDIDSQLNGLLINGDNYHGLSLIQKRMSSQVKMAYLDPPYNTEVSSIPYKNNYRHSSWAIMMRDRLSILRDLLIDASACYISIDKHERSSLEAAMDEVFGGDNKVEELIWVQNTNDGRALTFSTNHEYIEVYSKNLSSVEGEYSMFREPKPGYDKVMEFLKTLEQQYPSIAKIEKELSALYSEHKKAYKDEIEAQGLDWEAEKRNDPWKGIYQYKFAEYRAANGEYVPEKDAKGKQAHIWIYRESDWTIMESDQKQSATTKDPSHPNYRYYQPVHPVTKKSCSMPSRGWKGTQFVDPAYPDRNSMQSLMNDHRIAFGENESKVPQQKRFLHEVESNVSKSVIVDYSDGEKETAAMFGKTGIFLAPKHTNFVGRFVNQASRKEDVVIDIFGGTGSTGNAVIKCNRLDGGMRKYILMEANAYFDTIILPRIKKSVYSTDWSNGKPVSRDGISQCIKYIRLESYEDALNNLVLNRSKQVQGVLDGNDKTREQYFLNYMLDTDSKGSVLNLDAFAKPFDYQFMINRNDDVRPRKIDLVETFNYLIGLHVEGMRFVDDVYVVNGKTRDDKTILILWRDAEELDAAKLDKWFDKNRKELNASDFDLIYVNGDSTLQGKSTKGDRWTVKLIEEAFHRLMFNEASL